MRAAGQIASQGPQPQAQPQPHQPTEADYQALLASIPSESSIMMTSDAMSILPRFSHTSGADLDAHRVPQHVIVFVEQNRVNLQRALQDQSGFRAGLTSTNPGHQQLQQLQRQALVQGQGKSNSLQPGQLLGTQISSSSDGAQNQGRVMFIPMNAAGVNGVISRSVLPQSAGVMQIRRPTPEEVMAAKRWVDEQKKMAFSRG